LRFRGQRHKRGCEGGRLNVNHALIDVCIWFGLSFLGRYDLLWGNCIIKMVLSPLALPLRFSRPYRDSEACLMHVRVSDRFTSPACLTPKCYISSQMGLLIVRIMIQHYRSRCFAGESVNEKLSHYKLALYSIQSSRDP
jgi:hypothetical protein